ncbi:Transcriptional regulatory protein DegU [subsurface metagenome]
MTIKILLADDHRIMRDGLSALLKNEPDIEVVAEAENGREAVEMSRKLKPNVVVMDMSMSGLNGVEATRQILALDDNVKVLVLSMHADKRFVMGALSAGASGYVLKDCAFEELVRAIHTVAMNQTYLSPSIAGIVVESYRRSQTSPTQSFPVLTPREREVLQLVTEGASAKKIASILNVSMKTVETHRQHVMEKLNAHSVAELTKYAIREGLTSLDN